MNAQHSCKSAEWYTPAEWVERVRSVLGSIDLDPASCAEANEVIQAESYYTRETDGLLQPWRGTVFLNPPGGRGVPQQFWGKLMTHWAQGQVEAIYLAYSQEHLRWMGRDWRMRGMYVAIPHKRISFVGAGNSPTHANAFVYMGHDSGKFCDVFWDDAVLFEAL